MTHYTHKMRVVPMSGNIAGGPSCRLRPWAGGQSRDLAKVPVWDDILTPTIFWPRGQNIVMIYWPPLRYFDPPVIINNKVLFSFLYRYKLLDKVCHCFNTSVTNTLPNWIVGYFDPPLIIDGKVLFAFHIYLIRSILIFMILELYQWFFFDTTKSYPN